MEIVHQCLVLHLCTIIGVHHVLLHDKDLLNGHHSMIVHMDLMAVVRQQYGLQGKVVQLGRMIRVLKDLSAQLYLHGHHIVLISLHIQAMILIRV